MLAWSSTGKERGAHAVLRPTTSPPGRCDNGSKRSLVAATHLRRRKKALSGCGNTFASTQIISHTVRVPDCARSSGSALLRRERLRPFKMHSRGLRQRCCVDANRVPQGVCGALRKGKCVAAVGRSPVASTKARVRSQSCRICVNPTRAHRDFLRPKPRLRPLRPIRRARIAPALHRKTDPA